MTYSEREDLLLIALGTEKELVEGLRIIHQQFKDSLPTFEQANKDKIAKALKAILKRIK
jgi:hypothetical protein